MTPVKTLLVVMAILIGIIVALIAGFSAQLSKAEFHTVIITSGAAFAGAVTVTLLIIGSLGLP